MAILQCMIRPWSFQEYLLPKLLDLTLCYWLFFLNTALDISSYWISTPCSFLKWTFQFTKIILIPLLFSSTFTVTSTLVLMANLNQDTLTLSSRSLKHQLIQDHKQTPLQYSPINPSIVDICMCFCVPAPTYIQTRMCMHVYVLPLSEHEEITLTTVLCWFWCMLSGNWFRLPSVRTKLVLTACSLDSTNLYFPQPTTFFN